MSDYMRPVVAMALPFTGTIAGAYFTQKNMDWYKTLKTPSWSLQNNHKVYGPVWGALYVSMGYSSYLVWKNGGGFDGDAAMPLAFYGGQMALNWAWPALFFGMKSPKLAFVDVVCMWGAIAATIYNFKGVNDTAAMLLLPYLGWVTHAAAVNYRVWKDNPKVVEVGDSAVVSDKTDKEE